MLGRILALLTLRARLQVLLLPESHLAPGGLRPSQVGRSPCLGGWRGFFLRNRPVFLILIFHKVCCLISEAAPREEPGSSRCVSLVIISSVPSSLASACRPKCDGRSSGSVRLLFPPAVEGQRRRPSKREAGQGDPGRMQKMKCDGE